jgi:hypothetical protein
MIIKNLLIKTAEHLLNRETSWFYLSKIVYKNILLEMFYYKMFLIFTNLHGDMSNLITTE